MIRVRGVNLTRRDRRFLKLAAQYTMNYLLPNNDRIQVSIVIGPKTGEHDDCNGVCSYISKTKYEIWINTNKINKRAKTLLGKFSKILSYLVHELTHVKQYASGELTYIGNDKYRYKGKIYNEPADGDDDAYFESPDEIEAYGREEHLVRRFNKHWKKVRDERLQ